MPSIRDIRDYLESVPGALQGEPESEGRRSGDLPATPFYDPDLTATGGLSSKADADPEENPDEVEDSRDEPCPIFSIPPEIDEKAAQSVLSKEAGDEIHQQVLIHGIDALGWYATFHSNTRQSGVYIPVSGIAYMASRVFRDLDCPVERKFELGWRAILRHELFHFAADYMTSQWELAAGDACFWPSRSLKESGYNHQEEMLANAYMLRGFRYPSRATKEDGAYRALKKFTLSQPAGYNAGSKIVDRYNFLENCGSLSFHYQLCRQRYTTPPVGFEHLVFYPGLPRINWRLCPIHFIDDTRRYSLPPEWAKFIASIGAIRETDVFKKKLRSLGHQISNRWNATKAKLAVSTMIGGLDFKRWEGEDVFSVRVDRQVRAHIRLVRSSGDWLAESIGQHKEMGHG